MLEMLINNGFDVTNKDYDLLDFAIGHLTSLDDINDRECAQWVLLLFLEMV